jgi:hypothetical protein
VSDSSLAATALKLIKKHGRTVQLVRPSSGKASDPSKPWKLDGRAADPTLATVKAVFMTLTDVVSLGMVLSAGSTSAAMLAATSLPTGVVPQSGDHIIAGASGFAVLRCDTEQPGDVPILYTLHLKN